MVSAEEETTTEERLLQAIFGKSETSSTTKSRTSAVAHITMASEPTVGELIEFLQDLRQAYVAIYSFLTSTIPSSYDPSHRLAQTWFGEELYSSQDLVLASAKLSSPGFWEFLGSLNPLKVICDYLQQRHDREKDKQYRNRAEEGKLALENALLRNKVIKERVDVLKELGVPNEEIQLILLNNLALPLERLGRHVTVNLIGGAKTKKMKRQPSA